jgi:hypothetical protein
MERHLRRYQRIPTLPDTARSAAIGPARDEQIPGRRRVAQAFAHNVCHPDARQLIRTRSLE